MDKFSLNEMRTWGQSKSSSFCFCVWSESRELGGREKAPPQTSDWIPYVDSTRGAVNLEVWDGVGGLEVHDVGSHRLFLLCGHIRPPSGENAVSISFQ